ncbi:MAG TPA: hypothetical protein VMY34_01890 [Acidimicrobiales bacterium]|nr:hypothetical protein [Acidimicrobiales bacterium]
MMATSVAFASMTLAPPATEAAAPGEAGRIAYVTNRDGNLEIYSVLWDTTGVTNLTKNIASDYGPAWSPDGTKIAFTSNRDGNAEIYVMNADGTNQTRITANAADDTHPSWSPDGLRLSFGSTRTGFGDIYTMASDGSDLRQVTSDYRPEAKPQWSPDGLELVYEVQEFALPIQVRVSLAQPNGQAQLLIPRREDMEATRPVWSPDGSQVAFSRGGGTVTLPNGSFPNGRTVSIVNRDGTRERRAGNATFSNTDPSWSGDGAKLVWRGSDLDAGQADKLFIGYATGGVPYVLVTDPAPTTYLGQPAWQPVGTPTYVAPLPVVERLLVGSVNPGFTQTTGSLVGGTRYRITARGTYHWFTTYRRAGTELEPPESLADAECSSQSLAWTRNQFVVFDPRGDTLDLIVNDTNIDWVPSIADAVGCNTTDHTYTFTVTPAATSRFRFVVTDKDGFAYADNVGVLRVTIETI